ncbi:hypothetical protein HHI36_015720, partial [Cryptolaemus montrouzieri]
RILLFFCEECVDSFKQVPNLTKKISDMQPQIVSLKEEVDRLKSNGRDGKSRPAKAVFSGPDKVAAILKNKKKIVESSTQKISIGSDQTPLRRKILSGLRQQIEDRRVNGERGLTLRC